MKLKYLIPLYGIVAISKESIHFEDVSNSQIMTIIAMSIISNIAFFSLIMFLLP